MVPCLIKAIDQKKGRKSRQKHTKEAAEKPTAALKELEEHLTDKVLITLYR